jgi:hypothetical protein
VPATKSGIAAGAKSAVGVTRKLNLYGLSKLGDGRFVVMSNNGFTIWQV